MNPVHFSRIASWADSGKVFEGIPRVSIVGPREDTLGLYVVVIESRQGSGSALGTTAQIAFVKALAEAGESYLYKTLDYQSRTGMAGGFFQGTAVRRAQLELVERDAFLFHYRTETPFIPFPDFSRGAANAEKTVAFKLGSKDPDVTVVLVTDESCAAGDSPCLRFGVGAGDSLAGATAKAFEEFVSIHYNHRIEPGYCRAGWESFPSNASLADRHHASSRDHRNISRFRALCSAHRRPAQIRDGFLKSRWRIKSLRSPIRLLKYVRVEHPDLEPMTFGVPEIKQSDLLPPLYHPFM